MAVQKVAEIPWPYSSLEMFCALSGEAPEVPVLSRISGHVFEKRLLDSYVAENKKDPTIGEEMSPEDIVEIKTSRFVRPRPPNATSIPSLLSIFQNEWDALALETYQIKQQLYQTRQELSTALYQHDAACRVIARITKERDEAREALSRVSENMNGSSTDQPMETDSAFNPIPKVVQDVIETTMQELSAERKKRKVPEGWTTPEQLSKLKQHEAEKPDLDSFNLSTAMSDSILSIQLPSDLRVQAVESEWSLSGDNLEADVKITNDSVITALAAHPDGHLVALGSADGNVYIYHLLTSQVEAVFGPAKGPISCVSFSENGFWLAVVTEAESTVKIWHLGKSSIVGELEVGESPKVVAWDQSGLFLACAGLSGLKIWAYTKAGKQWNCLFETPGEFNCIAWQPDAQGLVARGKTAADAIALSLA